MPTALQQILDSIKAFDAENASLDGSNDGPLPGVASSHAACVSAYKESMKSLVKIWKKKVATLKAAKDANPELDAAKAMQTQFKNVQAAYQKCIKQPLHQFETPKLGKPF